MKYIVFALLLILVSNVKSQNKLELGLVTQGSWAIVNEPTANYSASMKNGFATGLGIYVSKSLVYRFSVRSGLAYQYKEMQQYKQTGISSAEGNWEKFPHHYVVIPVLLQYNVSTNFLVFGGLENAWLTNYEKVYQKPEHNWVLGIGSQKHKIQWFLSYIWSKEFQNFEEKSTSGINGYTYVAYKGNMLQLSLSYPLWQKK